MKYCCFAIVFVCVFAFGASEVLSRRERFEMCRSSASRDEFLPFGECLEYYTYRFCTVLIRNGDTKDLPEYCQESYLKDLQDLAGSEGELKTKMTRELAIYC